MSSGGLALADIISSPPGSSGGDRPRNDETNKDAGGGNTASQAAAQTAAAAAAGPPPGQRGGSQGSTETFSSLASSGILARPLLKEMYRHRERFPSGSPQPSSAARADSSPPGTAAAPAPQLMEQTNNNVYGSLARYSREPGEEEGEARPRYPSHHHQNQMVQSPQPRQPAAAAAAARGAEGTRDGNGLSSSPPPPALPQTRIVVLRDGSSPASQREDDLRKVERVFDYKIQEIGDTFYNAGRQIVLRDAVIDELRRELDRLRAGGAAGTGNHSGDTPGIAGLNPPSAAVAAAASSASSSPPMLLTAGNSTSNNNNNNSASAGGAAPDLGTRSSDAAGGAAPAIATITNGDDDALLRQLLRERDSMAAERARLAEDLRRSQEREAALRDRLSSPSHASAAPAEHGRGQQRHKGEEGEQRRHRSGGSGSGGSGGHSPQQPADDARQLRREYQTHLADLQERFTAIEARTRRLQEERDALARQAAAWQCERAERDAAASAARRAGERARRAAEAERGRLAEEVAAVRLSMARLLQLMAEVPALQPYLRWNEVGSEFVFAGYPTRYFPEAEAARAEAGDGAEEPEEGGGAPRRVGTGVLDGVYAGVEDTKNIWLSGRWAEQLRHILAGENAFTRRQRIKLHEMEEAGAYTREGLPSANDVVQCRRQERDYWIPYQVFAEAQSFKNRHYPKIPALSHFYPFLVRLNRIWLQRASEKARQAVRRGSPSAGDGHRQRPARGQSAPGRKAAAVPVADLEAMRAAHQELRRDVRLRVSSRNSKAIFCAYDGLVEELLRRLRRLAGAEVAEAPASHVDPCGGSGGGGECGGSGGHTSDDAGPLPPRRRRQTPQRQQRHREPSLVADDQDDGYSDGDEEMEEMDEEYDAARERDARAAAQLAQETTEVLAALLAQTCARVRQVSHRLVSETSAASEDLRRLMLRLQERLRGGGNGGGGVRGLSGAANAMDSARQQQRRVQREIRAMLQAQYGGDVEEAEEDGEEESGAVAHGGGGVDTEAVLRVVESVLDYGAVTQREVLHANQQLADVTDAALRGCNACSGNNNNSTSGGGAAGDASYGHVSL